MLKRKIIGLLLAIFLMLAPFGLQARTVRQRPVPGGSPQGYPFVLVDSYQRRVKLNQEPQRIISVAPNITELLFALHKGAKLVGRTDYCDYPPQARQIPSVGSVLEPSLEKLVALQPDLVIASTHFKKELVAKLEAVGIKVAVLYGPESLDGVYSTVAKVGEAVNARREAAGLVRGMQQRIARVTSQVAVLKHPKVYYVVGFGKAGDYTAGAGTFIGEMLELAGGVNVARDSRGWLYSREKLVEKNPDLIICSKYHETRQMLQNTPGYRDLPAVKAGRLVEIDNNLLDRQGPRIAEGLETLARLMHPDVTIKESGPGK